MPGNGHTATAAAASAVASAAAAKVSLTQSKVEAIQVCTVSKRAPLRAIHT